jgi:ABC-2 type transport system permease protein
MPAKQTGNFWLIVRHEARVMIADRTLPLIAALFIAVLAYGLSTGLMRTAEREQVVSELLERQITRDAGNIEKWKQVMSGAEKPEPFSNPVDPASIGGGMGGQYAVLPALPLAPVAAGQSDMMADYFRITYRSRVNFMYDSEIENPWNLLSGRFDLAFVLVYLFPLLIFAVSFNMISAERDQGTLRMLLSQPLSLTRLLLAKVTLRAAVMIGLAIIVPVLGLALFQPQAFTADGVTMLALLATMTLAYGLFWFALAALVNTFSRSSAANALILIGGWVMLVLVMPVLMNLAVSLASPAPSRTELAIQTRLITTEGLNRYNELLSADYRYTTAPDILLPVNGRLEVSPRLKAFYLMNRDVDARVQQLLDAFDQSMAGQQALVDRFGVLSPAIVMNEGVASVAGNGSRRYLEFQRQVIAYHESWKAYFLPRVQDGIAIVEEDFTRAPRWQWREEATQTGIGDALSRTVQLIGLALLLAAIAAWGLRSRRMS